MLLHAGSHVKLDGELGNTVWLRDEHGKWTEEIGGNVCLNFGVTSLATLFAKGRSVT